MSGVPLPTESAAAAEDERRTALLARLCAQVEFYFSLANLARDTYLRAALSADYPDAPTPPPPARPVCPVDVIAAFPKVRDLCALFAAPGDGVVAEPPARLLAQALAGSNDVVLSADGSWIGPANPQLPPPVDGAPAVAPLRLPGPPWSVAPFPPTGAYTTAPPGPGGTAYPSASLGPGGAAYRAVPPGPGGAVYPTAPPGPGGAAYPAAPPGPGGATYPAVPSGPGGAGAYPTAPPGPGLPAAPPPDSVPYPSGSASPYPPGTRELMAQRSGSPSSASLDSLPSQPRHQLPARAGGAAEPVLVAVRDLPAEAVNPLEVLSALTADTARPTSAFLDPGRPGLWLVAFDSEAEAQAAIAASGERTIRGVPVQARLAGDLPPSSAASLSSASAPGPMVPPPPPQMQQMPPVPLMGPSGMPYPLLPPGPASQMPGVYPPPYGMHPTSIQQLQPPPPLAGLPPGGPPYPPHPAYGYAPPPPLPPPYPGGYLPPHPHQPQHYPPPPGPRFGAPPPPVPRGAYPPSAPPPYPYLGASGAGEGYAERGPPPGPAAPPSRSYGERRSGAGAPDHHGHGGRQEKRKKHPQYQRREYGGATTDNGARRHDDYNNYNHYGGQPQRHYSSSPIQGDHRGKWKPKSGDQSSYRRGQESASPSFQNRNYNKHTERVGSGDRQSAPNPTPGKKQGKKTDTQDFLSSSDFPGLGGLGTDGKAEKLSAPSDSNLDNAGKGGCKQPLVGYASAVLKKKEADNQKEVTATTTAADLEVDSLTRQTDRQTEEMEREILSEFHDLSLIGDGASASASSAAPSSPAGGVTAPREDDISDGTAAGATAPTSVRSPDPGHGLPILPAGPFPGGGGTPAPTQSVAGPNPSPPAPDVASPHDFPSREAAEAATPNETLPSAAGNGDSAMDVTEKPEQPAPTGVWGSKRFADVI